jgi:F-type H+-transporting ATPase subunit delta
MTPRGVARRYATALFDVARKAGTLEKTRTSMADVSNLLAGNAELRTALESPAVSVQKKRAVVESLVSLAPDLGADVGRLLLMLAERDRLSSVSAIAKAFDERVMQEQGVIDATIITAVPLSAERQAALAAALSKAAGGDASRVRIDAQVDPSIIGGVIARVGSVVYDGSVTRQLDKMKSRLVADA